MHLRDASPLYSIQCPHCHSNNIVKSGKSSTGKQRYRCKNCRKHFISDYTYKAYLPNIDN
ncbi:MAG: IS1 family transposase [Prevotella histicola]